MIEEATEAGARTPVQRTMSRSRLFVSSAVMLFGTTTVTALLGTTPSAAHSIADTTETDRTVPIQAEVATVAKATCVDAIAGWSTPRLLAQLLMLTGTFTHDQALLGAAAAAGVGALELAFAPGVEPHTTPATKVRVHDEITSFVSDATHAGQVAPFISVDEEGGVVTRLGGMLGALPSPREMASMWTTTRLQQVMATRGREMKALGIDMATAPLYTTSPATNTVSDEGSRTFSASPTVAAAYGNAFAKGLTSSQVLAVAKSFPGEGYADADTDQAVATDPPIATLRTRTLVSFEKAVAAGVRALMVGHPVVPGLTDGQPASVSPATYALLRKTLGFSGLTITDTLGAKAISVHYSQAEAVLEALQAGADLPMLHATTWRAALDALEHAVSTGALSMGVVRTRVEHVLVAKGVCTSAL